MKPKSSQGLYPSYSSVSPATIPDPYPTFSTQHSQPPPSYSSTFYSAQPPTQDHYSTSHQTHSVHSQHSISHHSIPPSFAPQQSFIPPHKEGYPTPIENQPNQQYIPPPLPPDYGHPPRQSNPPSAAHYRGTPTLSNEAERLRNKCAELQSGLASAEQDMGHLKQQLKALLLKRRQMSFDLYEAQELIHQLGVGPPPRPLACISDLFGEPKPIPISTSNNIPVNNDHDDDEVPSNRLLVALSKQVRQEEFRAIVSALPEYISAEIKYDPVTKESKGIGIIKFASVPAAIKAKQVLINQEIGGRGIVINFAETEPTPVLKDKIKPKEKKIKTEKDSQRRSKSRNRSKERNKEIRRSRDKEDSFRRRDPSRGPPPPINVPRNEDRRRKSNERADEPPLRRRRLFDVGPNEFRNGTREGDGARSSWDYRGPPSSARDGRDGRDRESQPSFKMGGYRGGRGSSRNESHDGHRRQSPDDHNANDYNGREDHAESDGRADEDRHSDGNSNNGPASFRNRGRYSNRGRRGYVGTSSVSKSAGFRGRRGTAGGRFQR